MMIVLDKTNFTALQSSAGNGFSEASDFARVTLATLVSTSSARIVYNAASGQLVYNQNGSVDGLGSGGLLATLIGTPSLGASDFIVQA